MGLVECESFWLFGRGTPVRKACESFCCREFVSSGCWEWVGDVAVFLFSCGLVRWLIWSFCDLSIRAVSFVAIFMDLK